MDTTPSPSPNFVCSQIIHTSHSLFKVMAAFFISPQISILYKNCPEPGAALLPWRIRTFLN
uniref:Uncharacterized protein n=1 Tax=Anguilla anguilla TaxID=7936 RepID=A0A0E9RIF9_ANGAN